MSLDITRFCKGNIHRYFRVFILILSSVSFSDANHWRSLFVCESVLKVPRLALFSLPNLGQKKIPAAKESLQFCFPLQSQFWGKIREKSNRSIDFYRCVHFLFCRSFFIPVSRIFICPPSRRDTRKNELNRSNDSVRKRGE